MLLVPKMGSQLYRREEKHEFDKYICKLPRRFRIAVMYNRTKILQKGDAHRSVERTTRLFARSSPSIT